VTRAGAWFSALCVLSWISLSGCATIPDGRYGVDELELEGVQELDPYALRACLATRERDSLALDLSKSPSPNCGVPPFDARRIHLPLWRWPWSEWPLYDPGVFERDLGRVERWYRARGYYGARIVETRAEPEDALYGATAKAEENEIRLHLKIEEGSPVRIASVGIDGVNALEEDVGRAVLAELDALEPNQRFDEAELDRTKARILRSLRDAGYATALVQSEATVDPKLGSANIQFHVRSGPYSELGDVCVEGHGSLPARLILQASDLKPGEAYSLRDLEDARTRIYQMRVFSDVEIIAGRIDPKSGAAQFRGQEGIREGEWLAFHDHDALTAPETPAAVEEEEDQGERVCRLSGHDTVRPRIPIEIRVKPAKLYRFGVGTGIQIGVEDGQRAYTAARQWDTHVFAYLELRNFFGGLRRFRIEERPKLVFLSDFPEAKDARGDRGFELGNNLSTLLEWPAFLEARTLLRVTGVWDRGPDPFGGGFIRDDIVLSLGPSRDFLRNRLRASAAITYNPYIPKDNGNEAVAFERYNLLFLQQALEWDSRDDRSSPNRGTYARLELSETLPSSDWSYLRLIPEVRHYLPLPYGLVLAARAGVGLIEIYETRAKTDELRRLGPRPYRLRGGGPYSVRGVQAGALGTRDTDLVLGDNDLPKGFAGGTRSWITSIELRVPLGESLGIAAFLDAGDVDGGYGDTAGAFRFDHPNTTLGTGIRYKTIVGPLRLDIGWLVPGLQGNNADSRNVPVRDPLFKVKGAVHITIGEAF